MSRIPELSFAVLFVAFLSGCVGHESGDTKVMANREPWWPGYPSWHARSIAVPKMSSTIVPAAFILK
jgi:hypothetical protein